MVKKGAMRDCVEVKDNLARFLAKVVWHAHAGDKTFKGHHYCPYQSGHQAALAQFSILVILHF